MRLRNIIREYFTFTRNERIGLYVLICLIILLGAANQIIFLFEKPAEAEREEFNRFVKILEEQNKPKENIVKQYLFAFNPNTIDSISLDSLQLPDQIKRNLLLYREKGGKFKYKKDFKKLYGVTDSVFTSVKDFILLKSKPVWVAKKVSEKAKVPVVKEFVEEKEEPVSKMIELNSASESDLKEINGIGNVYSSRIIKYRNLLGGYYKIDQLKEVYGLSEETFLKVIPYLTVDTNLIQPIDVNFSSKKELVRHPYLSWNEVNAVFKYKSEVGFIKHINLLKTEKVLNDSIYQRVYPYLRTKNE